MQQPLNQTLYKLLELKFGHVGVVSAGVGIRWRVTSRNIISRRFNTEQGWPKSRPGRHIDSSGEEYRVSCLFCGDTRQRLYINHRWGVYDPETGGYNLFLCQCFNETRCLDSYERQRQLADYVFSPTTDRRMAVSEGRQVSDKVGEVRLPGPILPLDQLLARHPNHAAISYLRSRWFSPAALTKEYQIGYCTQSRYPFAQNRLVCPIIEKGQVVGWQVRYIGDEVPDEVPKYWSCPYMPRRLLAYNFEQAVKHPTVTIVEGPTDVWNSGKQSLGLMGKSMNEGFRGRFLAALKENGGEQTVAVVLDPEQGEEERRKGRPHHIDHLVEELRPALANRVFGVHLPLGYDAGNIDKHLFRRLVYEKGKEAGVDVQF